ncbi:MAG TPA: AMP-binding protein [Beijerinckiaceae bacterium]|nr:AMP-binding protein [Methylobacteriaceae bacterium]HRY02024.1 AMP-binding protein [Beijerinckiaceae bacterium]
MNAAVKMPEIAPDSASLPGLVLARALAEPARTVVRAKRLGIWNEKDGATLAREVADCAAGLATLGLKPGETAGILAAPCPEWLICDLAIQSTGAISAGFHAEAAPGELAALVARCNVRVLIVDTLEALDAALDLRDVLPSIETVVCFDAVAAAEVGDKHVIAFDTLLKAGADASARVDAPWRAPLGETLAAIIPTSGLSAPSKAAQFTHAALRAAVDSALSLVELRAGDERLALMPSSHAFERVFGFYACLSAGVIVNFPESVETVADNLRELQPQIVTGSPALWSGFSRNLSRASSAATRMQQRMFDSAMRGSGVFGSLVLRKVRRDFGLSRARVALSAGAPLAPDVARKLAALGVPVQDVYAVTEAAGAVGIAAERSREFALARGASYEISADGSLQLRSAALCASFAGEARRTSEAFEAGDLAEARGAGFALRGARDAAIGEHSAWPIEDALATSPYILAAIVSGDKRDRLSAIVFADYDSVVQHAQTKAIPFTHYKSLMEADEIRALIAEEVSRTVGTLGEARITEITIADRPFGPGDLLLGPAMNLRRRLVHEMFSVRRS